jgi:hypothetical protein
MAARPDDLEKLWDAVPPERQALYRRMYGSELRKAGATTDDAAELGVLRRLIHAYQEQGLVPVGNRWVAVPERVRTAARQGQPLPQVAADAEPKRPQRSQQMIGFLLLIVAGGVLYFLVALINRDTGSNLLVTPSPMMTSTADVSPTPTALALEESDVVIRAGEDAPDYYPVLLHVYPANGLPARVFVVQSRPVETADWRFDPNPDIASWLSGLLIRPVLGLPFSQDNLRMMQSLGDGDRFALQMNTGATLDFSYAETVSVTRQDTGLFAQRSPGLALVLIGETDAEGFPTARRWWVLASYPEAQESARFTTSNETTDDISLTPTSAPATVAGLEVHLTHVTYDTSQIIIEAQVTNSQSGAVALTEPTSWLVLGAAEAPLGVRVPPIGGALPHTLPPHDSLELRLTFAYAGEPYGRLFLLEREYGLHLHERSP